MTPVLFSILIPTLETRRPYLDRLKAVLWPQLTPEVSIEMLLDDGEETIGAKRQRLLESAPGRYVAFVDDDDVVSEDYVARIIDALHATPAPDVIGFRLRHFSDGELNGVAVISKNAGSWHQQQMLDGTMVYHRTPNHLSPIRRDWALDIGYPEWNRREDYDYSSRLFDRYGKVMVEKFIDAELYIYDYRHPIMRRGERVNQAVEA